MSNMMEYKGYYGSVTYSAEDKTFFGKVEAIRDLISFEGSDVKGLEKAFHSAVDDYLQYCKKANKTPDKPYKGSFNVRTKPEIHRLLALRADQNNSNINAIAEEAFKNYLGLGQHDHL